MSDVKKPDVSNMRLGWWRTRRGSICLVHGLVPFESLWPLIVSVGPDVDVRYTADGKLKTDGETRDDLVEFLPDCDSFDWKAEVFPQYWTTLVTYSNDRESNRPEATAFVIRTSKVEWNTVQKDGVHGPSMGESSRWNENHRTQLTKEQAEALLLPKESTDDWVIQNIAPARVGIDQYRYPTSGTIRKRDWHDVTYADHFSSTDFHGKVNFGNRLELRCRRKDLPVAAENTEDWVVQDRVPARVGVDERRFITPSGHVQSWGEVKESWSAGMMHGEKKAGETIEVRCRRKDFPETRTITITRWLCWNEVGKERLIHAAKRPNGFQNALNVGEEKFEVKP